MPGPSSKGKQDSQLSWSFFEELLRGEPVEDALPELGDLFDLWLYPLDVVP